MIAPDPEADKYTVKEMIAELRIDLRGDISEVAHKVADLERSLDVSVAEHAREHAEHDRDHAQANVDTAMARATPGASPMGRDLLAMIASLEGTVRVHENRWQRIIGVLLVLTFLGVASLGSILLLLWSVLQAIGA